VYTQSSLFALKIDVGDRMLRFSLVGVNTDDELLWFTATAGTDKWNIVPREY
jgi:hypothetical protein